MSNFLTDEIITKYCYLFGFKCKKYLQIIHTCTYLITKLNFFQSYAAEYDITRRCFACLCFHFVCGLFH